MLPYFANSRKGVINCLLSQVVTNVAIAYPVSQQWGRMAVSEDARSSRRIRLITEMSKTALN